MIAHFRLIFFAFLSLALGIWVGKLYHYNSSWFLFGLIIFFGIMLVFLALHFAFPKSKFFGYFWALRNFLIVILLFFSLGFGLYHIDYARHKMTFTPNEDTTYSICGTVDGNYIEKEKGVYFIISDVQVMGEYAYGGAKTLDSNVFVYLYYREGETSYSDEELSKILPGNEIVLTSALTATPVFGRSEINTFAYSNNYQYSCFTDLDSITFIDGQMNFWDSVREKIRNMYKQNMDQKYAGLAFSVLVGDRTELDPEIAYNFQISGIMHVVAVSGLNTAFIMILLLWVLKRVRANRYVKVAVIILVLLFYAILCDMTPSVVRSSMMSVFLITAQLFGKQRDDLTSISLSGIILLIIFPMYVFDLSFLLSYLGVFGIFLLYKPLERGLHRLKFGKLSAPIALTVSATLMTAPIIINEFGYFSLIGLLANLILVPLFGYVFMILFCITILALIVPFIATTLWLLQWGFWLVDKGAWLFASVPYAAVKLNRIPDWALVGWYFGTFFSSQQCIAKPRLKIPLATTAYAIFAVGFVLSFFVILQ